MNAHLAGIWRFRHFIRTAILNDFLSRIVGSRLGLAWMILHPLALVLMYTLVLSAIISAKLPGVDSRFAFALYLIAGIFAWNLFTEILTRCMTIYIDNANLLKKIVFPRICLPVVVTGSAILNNLMLLVAICVIFMILGHFPGSLIVWLPLLMGVNIALAAGLGLLLGVVNVFVRDVSQLVTVLIQFAFWMTPIIYPPAIIPESYRHLLAWNPMYFVVTGYQNVLVFNVVPDFRGLFWVGLLSLVLLVLAFDLFRRASPDMVDML